ncbi:50S ribosomal protein L7/L12 [Listeria monocytogenes]|nr:50S ribosomal protein L7/L12 [Listeria monocytogenes 07PF0776]KHK05124.1 50S ribosomal protein L7/L12 [Listeria monocytogenes SHL002]KHK20083.1 50S ribosomal protein L7/L12 [Listeria monocytogenes SHL008]GAT41738.1 50S ribosomal protein L7/L12 [Listeria monocytogenes]
MISSASSLATPSLRALGALSTNSLASFKPRPVISRTTLITLILESPAEASSTVNSVCSAAAPPAAATATGAAAVTPNSSSIAFTKSLSSNTDASFTEAMISSMFKAILKFLQ